MANGYYQTIDAACSSVQSFRAEVEVMQDVPVLSAKVANVVLKYFGNDVSLARRSLAGIYQKIAPHELGLPSDDAITGKVGGLAKKSLHYTQAHQADGRGGSASYRIRLIVPAVRNMRPTNSQGVTSFHFSFEAIRKNHILYLMPTKSGRRARPDEHGKYIEDVDKFDYETADGVVDPDKFADYQERAKALPSSEVECVYTNIEGTRDDRVDFFRRAALSEESIRPPSLTVDVATRSALIQGFLAKAADDEELAKAISISVCDRLNKIQDHGLSSNRSERDTKIRLEGELAIKARVILDGLGWQKKMQKAGHPLADAIRWDEGKSGRIQMRLVGEIPHELDRAGRNRFMRSVSDHFGQFGVPYVLVIHRPTAENHEKNWHFHLIYYDRPAERFDPEKMRARLHTDPETKAGYDKRYGKFFEAALKDPEVLAQAGLYDFEVCYTKSDARGREKTVRPFKQNKNRDFTKPNFVPDLRDKIAEISNRELERVGARRRVSAAKFEQLGIHKKAGKKLYDADHRLELAGIPTKAGSDNESKQWDYVNHALEHRRKEDEAKLCSDWDKMVRQRCEAGIASCEFQSFQAEWEEMKRAEVELRHQSRCAQEIVDRLFSRPEALERVSRRNLQAIDSRTANSQTQERQNFHSNRLEILADHKAGLKILFREELELAAKLEASADHLAEQAGRLLNDAGLDIDRSFARKEAPQNIRRSLKRDSSADLLSREESRNPVREKAENTRLISSYIDKIAKRRVPFSISKRQTSAETVVVVVQISASDRERYDLPSQIELHRKHHIARIEGIERARQSSGGPDATSAPLRSVVNQPPKTVQESVELVSKKVSAIRKPGGRDRSKMAGFDAAREFVRGIRALDEAETSAAASVTGYPLSTRVKADNETGNRRLTVSHTQPDRENTSPVIADEKGALVPSDALAQTSQKTLSPDKCHSAIDVRTNATETAEFGIGAAVPVSKANKVTSKSGIGSPTEPSPSCAEGKRRSDRVESLSLEERLLALDEPTSPLTPKLTTLSRRSATQARSGLETTIKVVDELGAVLNTSLSVDGNKRRSRHGRKIDKVTPPPPTDSAVRQTVQHDKPRNRHASNVAERVIESTAEMAPQSQPGLRQSRAGRQPALKDRSGASAASSAAAERASTELANQQKAVNPIRSREIADADLGHRIAIFTRDMQRKPSGFRIWDDGSVHPRAAIASSWGLSVKDLRSDAAKRALLPLYVEQELRFDRFEFELKWYARNADDLRPISRWLENKLSKDAKETLEIYRRSALLQEAAMRVFAELVDRRHRSTRKELLSKASIDWRAIDKAMKKEVSQQLQMRNAQLSHSMMLQQGF